MDVLLPTHARPHTIRYAVRSVLGQTHSRLRLHVVGDGCGDETEEAVRAIDDDRVVFYRLPKARGFGYENRNLALRRGNEPFVAYMTDDDLWSPDHLERALAALEKRPCDFVTLRAAAVHPPDTLDPHFFAFDWQGAFGRHFLRHWFMGAASLVHRRSVFDAIGYWNERLTRFGDREFYNRARRAARLRLSHLEDPSVLRFYSLHWDPWYPRLAEVPQARYLEQLRDPVWRAQLARETAPGPRTPRVRRRQWLDFFRFASRSGGSYLRFLWQRRRHPVR